MERKVGPSCSFLSKGTTQGQQISGTVKIHLKGPALDPDIVSSCSKAVDFCRRLKIFRLLLVHVGLLLEYHPSRMRMILLQHNPESELLFNGVKPQKFGGN